MYGLNKNNMTFEETGIRPELVKAVTELGFQNPMPVQEQVIPVILQSEQDVVALAQTGTGKTAAFKPKGTDGNCPAVREYQT